MSGMNIKVGGKGQLNIGNLAQGREVNINSGDARFAEGNAPLVRELLEAAREAAAGNDARVAAVQGNVQELGEALAAKPADTGKIKNILDIIRENHEWAFPAIAAIATKVVPALGALL